MFDANLVCGDAVRPSSHDDLMWVLCVVCDLGSARQLTAREAQSLCASLYPDAIRLDTDESSDGESSDGELYD